MNFKNELVIFIPSIEDGGVEKNLYLISNYLSRKIKNISLISADRSRKKRFNNSINYITPNKSFWEKKSRRFKTLICLILLVKKIFSNKKILILSFQANIYALIIANLFNIKIIVRSNTAPQGWNKNFIKKIIFKFFYKKADLVIVNSKKFKQQMKQELNINTECIYNPLDTHLINKKSKEKIKINFYKKNTLNLINVGRLTKQKDQLTILKAINLIKQKINLRLLIIGKGSEYNSLNEYIKKNHLNKIVKCIGYKKNPYPYIKKSDIFILSSLYEGLPNVLLESMYLKKFIISSDCPTGPSEILQGNKYGKLFKCRKYVDLSFLIKNYKNYSKNKKITKLAYKSLKRFDFYERCNDYYKLIKQKMN
jgi:glycosyltransferase involved in cell wall biosynthesis